MGPCVSWKLSSGPATNPVGKAWRKILAACCPVEEEILTQECSSITSPALWVAANRTRYVRMSCPGPNNMDSKSSTYARASEHDAIWATQTTGSKATVHVSGLRGPPMPAPFLMTALIHPFRTLSWSLRPSTEDRNADAAHGGAFHARKTALTHSCASISKAFA